NRNRLPKPRERQNDFGGVFGGPVWIPRVYNGRNKTFFFFSYEGLRLRLPLVSTTSVPSLGLRASAAPGVRTLLDAFPIPNGAELGNGLALFTASYSDPTSLNATSFRVDQLIGNRVTLFTRFNYSPSSVTTRNAGGNLSNPRPTRFETTTLTGGTTWTLS